MRDRIEAYKHRGKSFLLISLHNGLSQFWDHSHIEIQRQKPFLGKWKNLNTWRVLPRINFSFHPYQDTRKESNLQQWVAVCKKYESLQPSQSVLEENKCSQHYAKYRGKELMGSMQQKVKDLCSVEQIIWLWPP